jgi:tape measure domain-containing protein
VSGTTIDAGKLFIAVQASTENIKVQLDKAIGAVAGAAQGMTTSVNKINSSFDGMGKVVEKSIGVFEKFASSLSPAAGEVTKFFGAIATGSAVGTAVGNALGKVAEGVGELAKAFVEAGDEHQQLVAQLKSIVGSADLAEQAFGKLEEMTLSTGVAVQQTAQMFKQLAVAGTEVGITNDTVMQLVKTLEEAGVVAGASGQQVATVAQSLSVGFLQGSVNARQFRTIIVEMPQLATAIATSLGKTVEELMLMAKHGQLTADILSQGMLGAATNLDAKFKDMPMSMDRAWGIMTGGVGQFLAQLDNIVHASKAIETVWVAIGDAAHRAGIWMGAGSALDQIGKQADDARKTVDDLQAKLNAVKASQQTLPAPLKFVQDVFVKNTQVQLDQAMKDWRGFEDQREELLRQAGAAQLKLDGEAHSNRAKQDADDANTDFAKLKATYDRKFALKQKFDADIAAADAIAIADPSRSGETQKLIDDITVKYNEDLKKLNETKDAGAKKDAAEQKRIEDVLSGLEREEQAAEALYNAHKLGKGAIEDVNADTLIANELAKAGVPLTLDQTAALEDLAIKTVDYRQKLKDLTEQDKLAKEAGDKQKQQLEETSRELSQIAKSAAESISSSLYDALTHAKGGQSFVDYFKGLFKKIAVAALESNIVLPIVTQVVGGLAGAFGASALGATGGGQQLFDASGKVVGTIGGGTGAAGGSSGIFGSPFNVGGLAAKIPGLTDSIGLTGPGGLFGTGGFLGSGGTVASALSTPIFGSSAGFAGAAAADSAAGITGAAATAAPLTIGGALGGVGAGFGAGMLLNSLVGGKQTGGMVGSALGAGLGVAASFIPVVGPILGPLLGGLLGGSAGGLLGGLIGPGPKHNYIDIHTGTDASGRIAVTQAAGRDPNAIALLQADG